MAQKPLVPGPEGLFHFWPLPDAPVRPAPPGRADSREGDEGTTPSVPASGTAAGGSTTTATLPGTASPGSSTERGAVQEPLQEPGATRVAAQDTEDAPAATPPPGSRGRDVDPPPDADPDTDLGTRSARAVTDPAGPARTTVSTLQPRRRARPARERLLVTGISGGQGRLLSRRLAGHFDIVGIDREPWDAHPRHVQMHVFDLRRRKLEDLFRTERPSAVVHLAFVRHFDADPQVRHEVNVGGTRQLLEYCAAYGVERLVVLSSAYVYGALPDNPFYMMEEAALNVSRTYPEVRDLAEVDTLCSTFLWRYPQISTTILRPVNTLGYYVHSAVGRYLRLSRVPTVLGFDPLWQFIHEEDVTEAIALALETGAHGCFNVTGPGAVPLTVAIRESGGRPVPIPEPLVRVVMGGLFRLGLSPFPPGAIDFVKYASTVDGSRFRAATGFVPQFPLSDIFASARR